jgi:hypothetical protein
MKKILTLLVLLTIPTLVFSQIRTIDGGYKAPLEQRGIDSLSNDEISVKLSGKTKYTDYKVISFKNDTTYIDTTLTIQKEYKFNFRRKDNFGLLQFHNQGQTFNNLAYNFSSASQFPDIGFNAKQFNFMDVEDIDYYHVPTPTTEIMYRTGQEQGQVLDALFTLNFNKRLNASIAYKGLRSLGQYRRSLSATGNFRTTLSYSTPKDQYNIRAHVATQDFTNQESGGLTETSLQNFIDDDPNFTQRGRLDVNLNDTENVLDASRFYVDHNYKLFSSKDSTNQKDFSNLKLGHILHYEAKEYNFTQQTLTTSFFEDASQTSGSVDETTKYQLTNNQAYLEFNSKYILGKFKAKVNYTIVSHGYDSLLNTNATIDKIKLKGKAISVGGEWRGKLGNFLVFADAGLTPGNGHLAGNHLKGEMQYKKDSLFTLKGRLNISSKTPNFNYQLFQSTYNNYNWNNDDFDNVGTRNLGFSVESKWGNASVDFTNIEDYTYFDVDNQPQQHNGAVSYLKIKAEKEFTLGKFALNNTLLYQNVSSGSDVFRVPDFVTRNTLYYMDDWFKGKPLLVQIGATFNYFTKYKMNAYNPLLAEFTLQDDTEIGYPTLDVFFNARVRRTRIYFKLDNVTSGFAKKNYFSAPNYPYRDMSIRFGVVWNWFI